ncbi:hypothetical protein H5P36_19065 [Bacillus sp. APMAM]|nr:hypothetical protein [Bacillus sp. APMAM]RTZ54380.1 hypothetical protein EKO25_18530 [Bacillus sp. SAJ1]
MKISFNGCPPLNFERGHIICQLTDMFLHNVCFFDVFSDILLTFTTVKKYDREHLMLEIIPEYQSLYASILEKEWKEFVNLTDEFYSKTQSEFDQLRGDLLEYLLFRIGPINIKFNAEYTVLKDCRIYNDDGRIGENEGHTDNDLDLAFYLNNEQLSISTIKCEMLECKAKLDNYLSIREGQDPPIKTKTKQKLEYLHFIKEYFRTNKNFIISFATLQENVNRSKNALAKLNISGIGIINRADIANKINSLSA